MPDPTTRANTGEVFYDINVNTLAGHSAVVFVYPPESMYNVDGNVIEPYVAAKNDKLVSVDAAFLRSRTFRDENQDSTFPDGDFEGTNVGGSFYAYEENDYFYKYNATSSDLTALTGSLIRGAAVPIIAEAIKLSPNGSGANFENHSLGMHTSSIERHSDIEVVGLEEGDTPNVMGSFALRLEGTGVEDVTYKCFDTATIDQNVNTNITNASDVTNAAHSGYGGIDIELIEESGFGEASNFYVSARSELDGDEHVSAVEICNVERSVGNLRYGEPEDDIPFIYTGAHYSFSDSEIVDVEAKTLLEVDLDVWGGDCYIGLHTIKVSNSAYSLTDAKKDIDGSGAKGTIVDQVKKWGWYFNKDIEGVSEEDVNRPISVKGASQTVTVLLESEVNPEYAEKNQNNFYDYDYKNAYDAVSSDLYNPVPSESNMPVPLVDATGQIRSNFKYRYNLDYSPENKYKIFLPFKTYDKNVTRFDGRLAYSDQKIYLSDTEGFDRFRVLSIYDQDETYGAISSLTIAGDRVYSLQEGAVSYIPIIADTIETADGGNMSVRSGEIIGKPVYLDTLYGTQHPKTVKVDKDSFYFVDKANGEVCFVKGGELSLVSRKKLESYFTDLLSGVTTHSDLSAIYDKKKKEYWVTHRGNDTAVYSALTGSWVSRYAEDASSMTLAGVRIEDKMYLIGIGSSAGSISGSTHDVKFGTVYDDGTIGKWWNTTYSPQVKFFINQNPETVKTFDAYTIVATDEPDPQTLDVFLNDGNIGRSVLTATALQYREGTYRDKTLRITLNSTDDGASFSADSDNKRARGTHGEYTVNLNSSNKSGITSVLTKYRPSHRAI